MCLGVPGKITEVFEREGLRMGTVDFGGIRREACLEYALTEEISHGVCRLIAYSSRSSARFSL